MRENCGVCSCSVTRCFFSDTRSAPGGFPENARRLLVAHPEINPQVATTQKTRSSIEVIAPSSRSGASRDKRAPTCSLDLVEILLTVAAMPPPPKTVAITGAEGIVGSILRRELASQFHIVALTRDPQPFPSRAADIENLSVLVEAFRGADAVIHLAAASALNAGWDDVLRGNIVGTRNVFEAARQAGVPAVVYASSGHVTGAAEDEAGNGLYALDDRRVFEPTEPPRPDSLYAVSKSFGETIGRYYADAHGLRVICLRLGTILPDDNPRSESPGQGRSAGLPFSERYPRIRAKWLSHRDCGQLFACALRATSVRWAVVYGTSNNPRQIWDLEPAQRLLGYAPQDAAAE